MVHLLIDGVAREVPERCSVLDALRLTGHHVPALCHDERLPPSGSCRTCLVRLDGAQKLSAACTSMVSAGMRIEVGTPEVEGARRGVLALLAERYPAMAVERWPDKPFHREIVAAGLTARVGLLAPHSDWIDDSHPYISVDLSRCVTCERCVRICSELQGQDVWHVRGRGTSVHIQTDGPTLGTSSCVSCGACVDVCPTGALEDVSTATAAGPDRWTRTVCPYCGVGCELDVGTREATIVAMAPVRGSAVSKGHACVKGRYAFDFVSAADRVTEPMLREGTRWRTVSWREATAYVASRLRRLVDQHGPQSVGLLGSARATNEDNYVLQKFARAVLATNNVDCCARVCHAPSAAALKDILGSGLATNAFDDIERAALLLVCGANVTEAHPVLGARIKQAVRRGARLIVVDPRRIELVDEADCHLAVRPATNVALFNAMAQTIVSERLYDRAFLERRVDDVARFTAFIAQYSPENVASICGVAAGAIRRAARLYATTGPAMALHGLGLTEQVQGTDAVSTLINLALLTGNVGRAGAGVNPLRGQNNVQGAAHMGCDPRVLPGGVDIDTGRVAAEQLWGATLPAVPGLHMLEMMDAALAGRLKALWAVGYDVLATNPNRSQTARALGALDLLVVQDLFLTETAAAYGTVFLPACSTFEKDGTFMNGERRIQRVRAAVPARGSARPDWRIVCDVAAAMGADGFRFETAEGIWDEVRAFCEGARGMTYDRLERCGLHWPCPHEDHPGTPMLHVETFGRGDRAALRCVDWRRSPEVLTTRFPYLLVTGRTLYQFNAGTMTSRTPNALLRPGDVLDISPDDAEARGIHHGDSVRITSRYGSAILPAAISARVRPGQLFATFHTPTVRLNAVTGPYRDARVGTPAYKVTAVRLERLVPAHTGTAS